MNQVTVTWLSINQDIDSSLVAVTDTDRQYVLSNLIEKYIKEPKEPNFYLKIYSTERSEVTILLQKKPVSDIAPIKLTFYNIITKKQENVEFYNYIQNLEKYDFVWEHSALESTYSAEFSKDKNKLTKNEHWKNH